MLMAREGLPTAASMALSRDKPPPQRQNLLLLLPEYTVPTAIEPALTTSLDQYDRFWILQRETPEMTVN